LEIEQTVEQAATVLANGKPVGSPQTTKQTSTIEVDVAKMLIRMTTKDPNGKDLVVIRKGDRIAMKVGSGAWTIPTGQYAQMADQLGNPFACPLPKSGEAHSPRWTLVGHEQFDNQEATVIETVGNTANGYAEERMRDGLASIFRDPTSRPSIE